MPDNILLLQGPVGPFFSRLAQEFEEHGHKVFKINFNGGDALLYKRGGTFNFGGTLKQWPEYLKEKLDRLSIDRIYLFGDCRDYHQQARKIASQTSIPVFVFEEGYLRPHFITLEENGVNGHSTIPRVVEHYRKEERPNENPNKPIGNSFYHAATYAILYYIASSLNKNRFQYYQHHRPLKVFSEGFIWLKSLGYKLKFRIAEQALVRDLFSQSSCTYFLVVLQVHSDMQIKVHSPYSSVESFIKETIVSFANNAPENTKLILKHHPFDRGYRNYNHLIKQLGKQLGIANRLVYLHDWSLPRLLQHAHGVITINSTVGLSSIHHGTPVITMGQAIYDIVGLTFQGKLDDFWSNVGKVDAELYQRFRAWLLRNNQLVGSFYRRNPSTHSPTGLRWPTHVAENHGLNNRPVAQEKIVSNYNFDVQ